MPLRTALAGAGIVGAATMGLAAPAMADPPNEVPVTPNTLRQGEAAQVTVSIPGTCLNRPTTLKSTGLGVNERFTATGASKQVSVQGTAAVGDYRIDGRCDDVDTPFAFHGHLKVVPKGGASTGLGGSSDGMSLPLVGAGAALVVGAGGLLVVRRRRGDAQV